LSALLLFIAEKYAGMNTCIAEK